jgi:hypothetical protein
VYSLCPASTAILQEGFSLPPITFSQPRSPQALALSSKGLELNNHLNGCACILVLIDVMRGFDLQDLVVARHMPGVAEFVVSPASVLSHNRLDDQDVLSQGYTKSKR